METPKRYKAPRAGVLLMTPDKSRLLLIYGAISNKWSPPKGGMEPGETPAQNAMRECSEETGLNVRISTTMQPINIRKQQYFCLIGDEDTAKLKLQPYDTHEVARVAWLTWDEIMALPKDACNAITMELKRDTTREKIQRLAVPTAVSCADPPMPWVP